MISPFLTLSSMRFFSRLAIAVSLLAVPTLLFAYYMRPSELLLSKSMSGEPVDFSYDLRGSFEGSTARVWMAGAAEGKDVDSLRLQMNISMNVNAEGEQIKAKMQLRIQDSVLYFMLESLEGIGGQDMSEISEMVRTRQWYSLSLSNLQQEQMRETGLDEETLRDIFGQVLDAFLRMERTTDGAGSVYSIKLKRNAATELKGLVLRLSRDYPELMKDADVTNRDISELRRILSRIYLHLKVTTTAQDRVTGMKSYLTLNHKGFSLTAQGWATLRSTPVRVDIPVNAMPIEESFGSSPAQSYDEEWTVPPEELPGSSNDDLRRAGAENILNAVHQYILDHNGVLPGNIGRTKGHICAITGHRCREYVDLGALFGTYLESIPPDPEEQSELGTGYWIWRNADGTITVEVRHTDGPEPISVTR